MLLLDRTLLIKCKGFHENFDFPVYYVETIDDADGNPYVRSNVDLHFGTEHGLISLRVNCREEYDVNQHEIVHHYRLFRKEEELVKTIMTENGQRKVSERSALLNNDDISWALTDSGDDTTETESDGGGIILIP